jgi:pimeloyl-ACP methyl ester carboxylesterase
LVDHYNKSSRSFQKQHLQIFATDVRNESLCREFFTVMTNGDELWSAPEIEQQRLETAKGPLEYVDAGQGIPILYFHGNGVGNDAVVMMEKSLLDDGFRLIVPNRPGYYGTSLQCGRTPSDCADLGAALLDRLGIERAAVIGTSGGGPAACRFAARHGKRTSGLILQCALSHPFDSGQWMPVGAGSLLFVFRHLKFFMPLLRFGYRKQNRKLDRDDFVAKCMSKERFAGAKGFGTTDGRLHPSLLRPFGRNGKRLGQLDRRAVADAWLGHLHDANSA